MLYSFVLVNFNMRPLVAESVASLRQDLIGTEHEFLIADNSTDPDYRLPSDWAEQQPNVSLHFLENRGFVDALNAVMPLARGEFVIILHPDVRLEPGTLAKLTDFLRRTPRAGIVSPNLYYPDGRENKIRLQTPRIRTELLRVLNTAFRGFAKRDLFSDEVLWDRHEDANVETVMSVFMLVKRQVLDAMGTIDPRLWTYYANDYLCCSARKAGWQCYYLKEARAIHYERYTDTTQYSSREDSSYKRSATPVNARMERDRLRYLSSFVSPGSLLAFRALAFAEYSINLAFQFRHPRRRKREIAQLARTLGVVCGRRAP